MTPRGLKAERFLHRRDLSPLLSPRSIAVVGASETSVYSRRLFRHVRDWSFDGPVYPVNPTAQMVEERQCFPSVRAITNPVDLAFILVRRESVKEVLEQSCEMGVRAAVVLANGFNEGADPVGRQLHAGLVTLAKQNDILLCGPNCLGILNFHERIPAFVGPLEMRPGAGRLAIVSQSGGILCAMLNSVADRNLGLSYAISSGNSAVLEFCDYVEFLVDDERTDVICAFLESIPDPQRYRRVASLAAEARKPIVVIKPGRSPVATDAVRAHSGALAEPDDLVQTLFEETATIRAETIEDALDRATLFASLPRSEWPRGRNVAFFSVGGGSVSMFADQAQAKGIGLPALPKYVGERLAPEFPPTTAIANPIDLPGWNVAQQPHLMTRFVERCLEAEDYDAVLVAHTSDQRDQFAPLNAVRAGTTSRKPIIALVLSRASSSQPASVPNASDHVPVIVGIGRCVTAFAACVAYAEASVRPPPSPVPMRQNVLEIVRHDGPREGTVLDAISTSDLLGQYGLRSPRQFLAEDVEEAVAAARAVGYPVAVKSTGAMHKTELGGVRLWVDSDEAARAAYVAVTRQTPSAHAVLVQEMVVGGVEMYLGVSNNHPFYPPLILVGLGGAYVELLRDIQRRFAPIAPDEARRMLERLKTRDLVFGYRGSKPDTGSLIAAIVAVSHLALDLREDLLALDMNPIVVQSAGRGTSILDAKVVFRPGPPRDAPSPDSSTG